MRRIVFVGNCQVQALSQLYERFSGREERVVYLPSYEDLSAEAAAQIGAADVLVEQRMDVAPRAELDGIEIRGERVFVPLLAGGFLWPFAGAPHIHNESLWFLPNGPFDAEMGDGYLNRLLERGVPADDAVSEYLALDVNRARNLDRIMELVLDRQRARDEACGFRIAEVIEAHFRDEPVFRTPYHPNLRLTLEFAGQFFARMDVAPAGVARLHERLRVTPFPKNELPVHPSVARHFGLRWATEATRYHFHDEASLTFAEFVRRYARYEWNQALAEGIALSGDQPEKALPLLAEGLIRSRDSAAGWFAYSEALRRVNRLPDALAAARRGAAANPESSTSLHHLGHCLLALGHFEEAAEVVERAVTLGPPDEHSHALRASVAIRRGNRNQAEKFLREALAALPRAAGLHNMLGALLAEMGRQDGALASLNRAVELAPGEAWFSHALSHGLLQAGRVEEALAAAREAATIAPDNPEFAAHLQSLLARMCDAPDEEPALRAAIASDSSAPWLRDRLGHVLMLLNRPEEAAECFREAVALAPDAMGPRAGLSHALVRLGQIDAALAAAEAALARDASFAPLHVHAGNLLWTVGRHHEAEASYRAALELDPDVPDARSQLSNLIQTMRDQAPNSGTTIEHNIDT